MPYIEPLTFLAVRMVFVVVIMAAIALFAGARRPNANEIGHSLVAGSLVHGRYLGGVFTAISQGVPAGISALIPGLQPTSTLAKPLHGREGHAAAIGRACVGAGRGFTCLARSQHRTGGLRP